MIGAVHRERVGSWLSVSRARTARPHESYATGHNTDLTALHNRSMFASVIPATLMRPEPTT